MDLFDAMEIVSAPRGAHPRRARDDAATFLLREVDRAARVYTNKRQPRNGLAVDVARAHTLQKVCEGAVHVDDRDAAWVVLVTVFRNKFFDEQKRLRREQLQALRANSDEEHEDPRMDAAARADARDREHDGAQNDELRETMTLLCDVVAPAAANRRRGAVARANFEQSFQWLLDITLHGGTVAAIVALSPVDARGKPMSNDAVSQRLANARDYLRAAADELHRDGVLSPDEHRRLVGVPERNLVGMIAALTERPGLGP